MREEFVKGKINFSRILEDITTSELWTEIARRLNVRFGKIQVAIHEGKPSKFANVDLRIDTEDQPEKKAI